MSRYTVECVKPLGHDRFETWLVSPEGVSVKMTEIRPNATQEEMEARAERKCKKLNSLYGPDKFSQKESTYRTINKALLEEQLNGKT